MIARLIAWSARNLVLVLSATAFVTIAGIFALRSQALYHRSAVNCAPARQRARMNFRLSSVGLSNAPAWSSS